MVLRLTVQPWDDLELLNLLLSPRKCFSYRYRPPHLVYIVLRTTPGTWCMLGKHGTTCPQPPVEF